MQLNLLEKKLKIKKNGVDQVDLLTPSIRYTSYNFDILDAFYVGEDLEMRPDLLSKVAFGNTYEWDVICKFNGISNPFAISRNDFIMVPELGWMDLQLHNPIQDNIYQDIRSQYLDEDKYTQIDQKKQEYNKLVKDLYSVNRKAKFNETPLPPNLAQFGETEIKIDGKSAILGGDVSGE